LFEHRRESSDSKIREEANSSRILVVFYHARVSCKPARAKEVAVTGYEYDLTREDLRSKIAIPFIKKEQFFCGGAVILPDLVSELKFSETQQTSQDLVPFIEARRRMRNVVVFSDPAKAVLSEGKDVTREILDEAKAYVAREEMPAAVEAEEIKSDRIFIVHGHDERAVDQTEILGVCPSIQP
jgi:hypothetical protein